MQHFDVFLNLHKDAYAARPVTFRNAVLLSEGKLIVSERAYAKDETEYDGMILFSDDIVSDYHRLVDDVDVATQFLRRASEKFPARFAPVELFRRAGINLRRLGSHRTHLRATRTLVLWCSYL